MNTIQNECSNDRQTTLLPGTVFGVSGGVIGGEVLTSLIIRQTACRCGYTGPR